MNKYILPLACMMLSLFSCSKVATVLPPAPVVPSSNVITVSDGSYNFFDTYPAVNITNQVYTTLTSVLTINMSINTNSSFNLALTVYGTDTTDKGTFTEYNDLTYANSYSVFTNDGHGNATSVYDYTVDSAVVTVSGITRNSLSSAQVTGTYQLWLQPNLNSLARSYKQVTGTFNSTAANVYYQ